MNMNLKHIIIGMFAAAALAACSNIAEDDRLIYVQPAEVKRAMIIEDFTGQRCVNCPAATDVITQLQQHYGADTLIAVGIHSGSFARKTPLHTDLGDEYFNHWAIKAQPGVIINHTGAPVYNTNEYGTAVAKILSQSTPVTMELTTAYNAANSNVDVTVSAQTSEAVDTKLQVYVLEDGIVSWQLMGDGSQNRSYVHNHVFRASITKDNYGDVFALKEGVSSSAKYSFTIDKEWKAENISVVAFVYTDKDGVLQATKKHITETKNE